MNSSIAISAPETHAEARETSKVSRYAATGARVLLGLLFLVLGLNGLVHFIPDPPPGAIPEAAMALTVAFAKTGYLIPLLGATQTLAGALLLAKRFVPLALTILAPIVVNIVAYHAFLAPEGIPIALLVLALEIALAVRHRAAFLSVLAARA